MFNLNPSIFKDSSSVNIQLIAPELMHLFNLRSDVSQGVSSYFNKLIYSLAADLRVKKALLKLVELMLTKTRCSRKFTIIIDFNLLEEMF